MAIIIKGGLPWEPPPPQKLKGLKTVLVKLWFGILSSLAALGATAAILCLVVLRHSEWHDPVLRLLSGSWRSFVSSMSTNTVGFIMASILIPVIGGLAVTLGTLFVLRKRGEFWRSARESLLVGGFVTVTMICLWLAMFGWNVVKTIYDDHQSLVAKRGELALKNADLALQVDNEKNTLANMMELQRAFISYRREIGFSTPCHISFTAPPDSMEFCITVAQLATQASQCVPFGPESFDMNPDAEREAMNGMVPGVVVFHIARGEGTQLFVSLENSLRLKLSYEIPSGSPEHFVWLQFGSQTKWNSQIR
jgi:hypothetical protein